MTLGVRPDVSQCILNQEVVLDLLQRCSYCYIQLSLKLFIPMPNIGVLNRHI